MTRSISTLLALLVLGSVQLRSQELFRHPFVGAVTENSATIQVWLKEAGVVLVHYGTNPGLPVAQYTPTQELTAATSFNGKFVLTGLEPNTRYYYRVTTAADVPISEIQEFSTFPPPLVDAPVNILFGSCQQRTLADVGAVFDVAPTLDPDLFIQLGDWTYADELVSGYPTTDLSIEESYAIRLDTNYPFASKVLSATPIAYMWDDHDWVGNNTDGNISAEMRARLLAGYRNHIPHYPLQNQAGLWQQFTVGNVEFFMIDDRSQRRPVSEAFSGNTFNPPPGHSMLSGYPVSGTSQREWLFDAIRRSKARWKILVSPVFFNPAAATAIPLALFAGKPEIAYEIADKWVGYPAEVDSMKALFRAGYDRNFAIISGDAHTNIYDDGTHSLVPEFMVGNLDIANSKLDSMLRSVGFNIWTASQPGSERTIGRIRVETTPKHRLILESFDENGRLTLSYEMVDTSSTVGVHEHATAGTTVRSVSVVDAGTMLLIETAGLLPADAGVTLYSLTGELVFTSTLDPMRQSAIRVALPSGLTVGTYLARITGTELDESFQVMVIR